eukprot:364995-Chlamydomonas_euryale.AAC.11
MDGWGTWMGGWVGGWLDWWMDGGWWAADIATDSRMEARAALEAPLWLGGSIGPRVARLARLASAVHGNCCTPSYILATTGPGVGN